MAPHSNCAQQLPGGGGASSVRIWLADTSYCREMAHLIVRVCREVNDPTDFSETGRAAFEERASCDSMVQRSRDPALEVRRYAASVGSEPAIVGMSEMFRDTDSNEPDAYKLMYVFVDSGHHGMGIGSKLVQAQLAQVPPGGLVSMRSAPAALPFYERFGFRVVGPASDPATAGIRGLPMLRRMPTAAADGDGDRDAAPAGGAAVSAAAVDGLPSATAVSPNADAGPACLS